MLRGVALGLAVLGLTGTIALGQTVSINDAGSARGYGEFGGDDSFAAELWLADFGELADFSVAIDTGSAVTLGNFGISLAQGFPNAGNPLGWSQFLNPAGVDTTGGVLAATFDVTIAGGDGTNSFLGVDYNSGDTFVSSSSGAAPIGAGLSVGGQLVPEPATMALLLAGVGGGLVARRRRRS